jgi:hypothetical protein
MSKYGLTKEYILSQSEPDWDTATGVYFLIQGCEIVYVGQSVNVLDRIYNHRYQKDFDRYYYIPCLVGEMGSVENYYIKKFNPVLNMRKYGAKNPTSRFSESQG